MKSSTKYLKITINILSMIFLIVFCIWILPKILVFFMPFVVAGIIAFIANPLVRFLDKKLKIVRKWGTAVVIMLVITLVVLVMYFVIAKLVTEITGFMGQAPVLWDRTSTTIKEMGETLSHNFNRLPGGLDDWFANSSEKLSNSISEWVSQSGTPIAEMAGNVATNLPTVIIYIIMGIIASYLFLAEKDYVFSLYQRVVPGGVHKRMSIVYSTMTDAVGGYFKAQFKIMCVVYVILLIGFAILKVDYALLIALLIAILDFLPFFGTGTAMVPWAAIAFFREDYKFAVGMMIVWAVSQLVRQIIQPQVLGNSVGLEPIPTLFFLYIGFKVGGALGLVVAIPIGMIVINLQKAGVFSNFVYSLKLISLDLSRLRKFDKEELKKEGIIINSTLDEEDTVNRE